MARDRVICSGEKICGCWNQPTKRQGKETILVGDPNINPVMKNCGRFVKGHSETVYCGLTRERVHIIK